ncbi:lysylphosphatidylglycerol synthase domain-containing protein [Nocardioides sambongensis]|uniref:lysylphosphatidylglycerol synthase domain-containing protein n=1 Tax=Nocardioides sambongensis TaxID=2589074 RepID=UPI00112ACE3C|nr:lysylphosphatidylglycerol synthase domain-containing protein [Nocardioides sambongensis]
MVAAIVATVIIRVVGVIDWASVGAALGHLAWWQPLVLVAVLLVRQFLNALPLALYIPGVGPFRATVNDQLGIMMASVAPPPGDMAIRVALFRAWGVPVPQALAGTTLNMLTFYIVRFGAPVIGFALLLVTGQEPGLRWLDLLSVAIAVGILAALLMVISADRTARAVGDRSGRIVRRFRHSVDPAAWAEACATFRHDASARFRWGFPRSLVATVGMLIADLTLLLLCLRFVGLDTTEISVTEVAIAYFFAYPFTVFFFSGLGIVDALIIAALVEQGGPAVESAAVAGLIVWRVFFIGGPIVLGLISLAFLRTTIRGVRVEAERTG